MIDELAPQDIVNPIDVSRFVLHDGSEGRPPVPLARLRLFLPAELTVEGLVVPVARRGVFDQFDEAHSRFAPDGLDRLPQSDLDVTGSNSTPISFPCGGGCTSTGARPNCRDAKYSRNC